MNLLEYCINHFRQVAVSSFVTTVWSLTIFLSGWKDFFFNLPSIYWKIKIKIFGCRRISSFFRNDLGTGFSLRVHLQRHCPVLVLSPSVEVLGKGQGALVQRVSELHSNSQLDKMRHLGKEVDQSILGGGTKVGSTKLACYSKLLERLGVDGGLDDVHHHLRRDRVRLQVQRTDQLV